MRVRVTWPYSGGSEEEGGEEEKELRTGIV